MEVSPTSIVGITVSKTFLAGNVATRQPTETNGDANGVAQ